MLRDLIDRRVARGLQLVEHHSGIVRAA